MARHIGEAHLAPGDMRTPSAICKARAMFAAQADAYMKRGAWLSLRLSLGGQAWRSSC